MKKLLIGTALLFAALPFTFDGITPAVSKAQAVYRGIHHRHVVPAAAVGAAATGAGWGWNPRVFAYSGPVPLFNPSARYGCYPAPFDYSTHYCAPRY
jgi:hypothetical protein